MATNPTTHITAEGHTVVIDNGIIEVTPANPNPTLYLTRAGITGAITRRLRKAGMSSGFKAEMFGDFACTTLVHSTRAKAVIAALTDAGYQLSIRPANLNDCYRIGVIGNMTYDPIND